MPTLSPAYDIFSLIDRYASIQVAYKSVVKGVLEIHSNCPWCPGSKDSFIMQPEIGRYSHAIRSGGCDRTGDCIDFLRDYCSMTRREACEILGLEINGDFVPSSPSQSVLSGNESPPCKEWQSQGKNLVERAQHALWNTSEGRVMLDYLHGRGLDDEIIKKKKIGFIPLQSNGKYYESELEDWGLDPAQETKDKVRIPNGILIPWFEGSALWRLAIKRPGEKQSYGQVLGSGEGFFNVSTIQYDFPAMIVEGEICAMSVEQECGDLVACVATGSTTRARLNRWVAELGLASYVFQSFDEDDSGDTGAEYWMNNLKKCQRWSPYVAKDPNDILRKKFFSDKWGCTLREWVEAGIGAVGAEFGPSLPFVLPPIGGIENVSTIPLARGMTLNELVQERRKEKGLPPMPIHPWSQKDLADLEKAFSKTKVHGPEVDLNALSLRECVESYVAPISFVDWKQRMATRT